jgi:hypothetical protein
MFSRTVSRIALASVSALVVSGALAAPALAQGNPVGPKQYFYGEVFGASVAADVIVVSCPAGAAVGNPVGGQSVAAHQIFPPVTTTVGYTGNFGTEIDVSLTWPSPLTPPPVSIGEILYYDTKVGIPTSITVPCSGSGVMIFNPSSDPDGTGRPSDVSVTFVSNNAGS